MSGEPHRYRCAVYTRFSSDLQNPTSSEDQIRNCRAAAKDKGWDVLDEYIRCDEELTGARWLGEKVWLISCALPSSAQDRSTAF